MPVYSYRCDNCDYQFDQTQKFTDPHLVHCPRCQQDTLRKVFVPVSIVFKGKGFYATDNRSPSGQHYSSNSSEEKSTEKSVEKVNEKVAESKSESKSETKTDSKPAASTPSTN